LRSAKLPKHVSIGAIVRGDEVVAPRGDTIVEPQDRVILFAERHVIGEVEKILSVRPDFF
jgi:trk system potassium uptake protein TrkA